MSKKISEKEIKIRQAKKFVEEATPYSCAVHLMQSVQSNPALAVVLGLTIAEVLKGVESGIAPKDKEFSNYVAQVCNDKQIDIHKMYPNEFQKPFPVAGLLIYVLQIIDHAQLATGIHASLTPMLVDDKLTVDIKTDPQNISLLDAGTKYINEATAGVNLFADAQRYTHTFINLVLTAIVSIIDRYQEK